uniref:uncharacterized protein n=1 Tax=Myxine glutinosa TaxID=7769 RepID=UPI0035900B92
MRFHKSYLELFLFNLHLTYLIIFTTFWLFSGARSKVGPSVEKCSVPPPAVSTQRPVVSHTSKPSTTCMPPRVGLASGTRVRKYAPTLPNKVSSLPGDSKAGTQAPTTAEASNARPKAKVSNDVRCPTASMKTTTLKETGDGASADVKSFVKDKPVGKILPRKVEASTARSKPTSKDKPTRSAMAMPRAAPVRALQGNLQTRTARNASAKTTCNFNTSRVPPLGKKSETGKVRSKSMPLHKADVGTARPRVTKERVESTLALPELPKQTEEPTCTVPPENIARTAESDVSSPHEKKEEQTMNANEVADEGNPEVVIVQGEDEHYSTDLASEDKSV